MCLFSEILIRHAAQESGYWTLADFWSLVASLSHQLINRGTHILTKWMGDRNRPLCFFCLSRPNDFLKCCIFKGSDKCPHFAGWKYCMYGCRCFPISGWWFQTFFIFHNIRDNPSHWLIFFRGHELRQETPRKSRNQDLNGLVPGVAGHAVSCRLFSAGKAYRCSSSVEGWQPYWTRLVLHVFQVDLGSNNRFRIL